MTNKIEDISQAELDALIHRVEEAIEHDLGLNSEDLVLLLNAIQTLAMVQSKLESKDVTLLKLKKLLGMVSSSEKRSPNTNRRRSTPNKTNKKPNQKKPEPKVVKHGHKTLKKGDPCPQPDCDKGKLYPTDPKITVRISGHAPFEATKHVCDRLRCNQCGTLYIAEVPEAVLNDGDLNQMYGYSARALMAINKFYSAEGYHHQQSLSAMMGHPVSASTVFDQVEYLANDAMPIIYQMKRDAAKSPKLLGDDTYHRILDKEPEIRPNRNGKGNRLRTGIYSSCIIAKTHDHHDIVIMETSLGHFGEAIDDILRHRPPDLPPPLLMSDALSSNTPTACDVLQCLCNAHGNRQFKDIESFFPEVTPIIDQYCKIWTYNRHTKENQMSDQERLLYHQKHSLPIMEAIKKWCEDQLQDETFEENSALGKAVRYFTKHYSGLCRFCHVPGAELDNNQTEQTLKITIRGRKTYMFFKTDNGAGVANVITSLIATAWRAGINVFEYLTDIQRYKDQVKASPELWVPYRYESTIKLIQEAKLAA